MSDQQDKTDPKPEQEQPRPEKPAKRSHHAAGRPRGDHAETTYSPVHVNPGLQPPRDGERCGDLTYDAALHMWLYVASYHDPRICWRNRAEPLHTAWGVPFLCVFIGDTTPRADHRARPRKDNPVSQRYIPGWYAATYADPRAKRSPGAGSGFPPGRPKVIPIPPLAEPEPAMCQHTGCWRQADGPCGQCGKPICAYHAWYVGESDLCAACAKVRGVGGRER